MKCDNCGYNIKENDKFCANCGNDIINKTNNKDCLKYSILSIVLGLIPIIIITAFYIYSGGDLSENGAGAIFWLVPIYFFAIGFPIAGLSVFLGFKSFKIKKNILSIIGMIIGSLPFIYVAAIAIIGHITSIIK